MKKSLLCLILSAIVVGGCVTHVEPFGTFSSAPPPATPAPHTETKPKEIADQRVIINAPLDHIIRLLKITSSTSSEGFLKFQLNIQNMTDAFQKFRYRIDWLDADGLTLPLAETTAMDWTLLKGETSFLAATAPTLAAKQFRVIFAAN